MLLHVVHETAYDYTPAVKTAQHLCHLKPIDDTHQRLVRHALHVEPTPAQRSESLDLHGNARTFFSLQSTHEELRVVADSVVATRAPVEPTHDMPWEEVRERMRYHRAATYDPASQFVFASHYVPRAQPFADYARASFAPGRPWLEAAQHLMTRIHEEFEYESCATEVSTPALEALEMRKGVCQDFAHIMLACLRTLGLPARYVSGYLLTKPPPGQAKLVGSDASHAWVSIYLPGEDGPGAWTELDPTNDRAPGEDYVRLAVGRDFADVSPMRGVLHGGANHSLRVAVTVAPLEDEPAAEE